jgi:hypothetical protein
MERMRARRLVSSSPPSGVSAMPDPDGYAEAISLFEKNLERVGGDSGETLRNLSAGLYHLSIQIQADMTALKEHVGVEFRLGNTPEE